MNTGNSGVTTALEIEVLKLFTVERAKPVFDFFDAFGVVPVRGFGEFVDLNEFTR